VVARPDGKPEVHFSWPRSVRLALLRHGPTLWNAQGRIQGHTDIPLSDDGIAKMRRLLPPPPFGEARVFVSTSRRARAGAATVAPSSIARTSSSVSGLPSMAVEEWVLRVRVSFCNAGIQGTCTAAP